MHASRQALLVSDPREESKELLPLLDRKRSARRVVVGPSNFRDVSHEPHPLAGQVKGIHAPILGIVTPLEQTALLELVDERDETAGKHPQERRQLLLTYPGLRRDRAKDPGMGWGKLDLGHPLAEAHRRVGADLSQQKGRRAGGLEATFRVRTVGHERKIAMRNRRRYE
jgi:hypothetical protein